MCRFGMVSIRNGVFSRLCPFGIVSFRIVYTIRSTDLLSTYGKIKVKDGYFTDGLCTHGIHRNKNSKKKKIAIFEQRWFSKNFIKKDMSFTDDMFFSKKKHCFWKKNIFKKNLAKKHMFFVVNKTKQKFLFEYMNASLRRKKMLKPYFC